MVAEDGLLCVSLTSNDVEPAACPVLTGSLQTLFCETPVQTLCPFPIGLSVCFFLIVAVLSIDARPR